MQGMKWKKKEKKWEFSRQLSKGSAMTVIKCPTLLSAETLAQKVSFEELTVFLPSVAQYCTLLLLPVRVLIIMIANA